MLKDYYYTDKEELDALRKENEELKRKLKDYALIIENLRDEVITYRFMKKSKGGKTNGKQEN